MTEGQTSRFESLILPHLDAFRVMVEGALKERDWSFDVLLVDTKQYVFKARGLPGFRPFCAKLRDVAAGKGEELCLECDLKAATEAGRYRKPTKYPCHAGLIDVAVPLFINDKLEAAILVGQVRSTSDEWDAEGILQAQQLERRLGLAPGELLQLRGDIPRIPDEEIDRVAERLLTIASFVSRMLEANQQLQLSHEAHLHWRERTRSIEKALRGLAEWSESFDKLWHKVEDVLNVCCDALGACHAAVLVHSVGRSKAWTTRIEATCRMPPGIRAGQTVKQERLFAGWESESSQDAQAFTFDAVEPGTLCNRLAGCRPAGSRPLATTIVAKARLPDSSKAIVLAFLEEGAVAEAELDYLKAGLQLAAGRIAEAYRDTDSFVKHQESLTRLGHQMIAPAGGIVAYAAKLQERWEAIRIGKPELFSGWQPDDIQRWANDFESTLAGAQLAARLARNLIWTNQPRGASLIDPALMETVGDVPSYLIARVRVQQSIAHARGIEMIHVDESSTATMNGRLRVHKEFFEHAFQNLIDNAIKYATRGTGILVTGGAVGNHCTIQVANYGIQLREEDTELIFKQEYRTVQAKERFPTGTGIGLKIARQMIELQGGRLTAEASRFTTRGWLTVFTIRLPAYSAEKA